MFSSVWCGGVGLLSAISVQNGALRVRGRGGGWRNGSMRKGVLKRWEL